MADVPGFTIHPGYLKLLAIATPHQSRQNIGSEVPIFHRDSFPPGEAKNSETMRYYHPTERSVTGAAGRQVGDPYRGTVEAKAASPCGAHFMIEAIVYL